MSEENKRQRMEEVVEMAANRGLTVREFALESTLMAISLKCEDNRRAGRQGWHICNEVERLADEVLSKNWGREEYEANDVDYLISRLRQYFPDPRDLGEHLMKEFNES